MVFSGHYLASMLLGEGKIYMYANSFRKVMIQILSGVLSPSSNACDDVFRLI
jgi:hypothetical protein